MLVIFENIGYAYSTYFIGIQTHEGNVTDVHSTNMQFVATLNCIQFIDISIQCIILFPRMQVPTAFDAIHTQCMKGKETVSQAQMSCKITIS